VFDGLLLLLVVHVQSPEHATTGVLLGLLLLSWSLIHEAEGIIVLVVLLLGIRLLVHEAESV
jgi:hypothetical protein